VRSCPRDMFQAEKTEAPSLDFLGFSQRPDEFFPRKVWHEKCSKGFSLSGARPAGAVIEAV